MTAQTVTTAGAQRGSVEQESTPRQSRTSVARLPMSGATATGMDDVSAAQDRATAAGGRTRARWRAVRPSEGARTRTTAARAGTVVARTGTGALGSRVRNVRRHCSDAGMATAEYAIATLAAVGFAGLLVVILKGNEVKTMLMALVRQALSS